MPFAAASALTPTSVDVVVSGVDTDYVDEFGWRWKLVGADGLHTLSYVSGAGYVLHFHVMAGNNPGGGPPPLYSTDYSLAVDWLDATTLRAAGTWGPAMGDFDFAGDLAATPTPCDGVVAASTGGNGRAPVPVSVTVGPWQ